MSTTTTTIALLLYDDVELLDHAGPYEVFTTAARMHARQAGAAAPARFEVIGVAATLKPVRARAGLRLMPDADFTTAPPPEVLIVPGGVVDRVRTDAATRAWIATAGTQAQLVASVCTGAFLLADAGLLPPGARCTTHWEDVEDLRRAHPALQVEAGPRWIWHEVPGRVPVVSSAGISAGIDLALHLIERLAGRALAERTARQMDYRWLDTP